MRYATVLQCFLHVERMPAGGCSIWELVAFGTVVLRIVLQAPAKPAVVQKTGPFLIPIADPLADEKLAKKVLKLAKRASKRKQIKRGVKEVVKAIRKKFKGCGSARPLSCLHTPAHFSGDCPRAPHACMRAAMSRPSGTMKRGCACAGSASSPGTSPRST